MTCDSEIKLFGKIFPVIFSGEYSGNGNSEITNDEGSESVDYQNQEVEKDDVAFSEGKVEEEDENRMMEESENFKASLESENSHGTPTEEDPQTVKSSETENEQNNAINSQQKSNLTKPDKILPCPRCNSMDTKFCYYNNNNVNQPRHFCRSCQRYWTAGGTMRNLPVGAGRRKNKNFASHYRHMSIPEGLLAAGIELPNGFQHQMLKPNGTVLSFGPDVPLGESMASALNPAEERASDVIQNGFYNVEHKNSSCKGGENGDECSRRSSFTTSNTMAGEGKNKPHEAVVHNINSFSPQVPSLHGVPWPFPWNAAVPMSAICPIGFPMPFYPAPYWNCSVPPWSIPWLSPPPQPENEKASSCAPNSALGKHSREGDLLKPKNSDGKETSEQKNSERTILVPKTLRIDDPDEAAKSSIWSTLGIKYDSASRERFFKALQPRSDDKDIKANTSTVLHTNPAALSRSLIFQEKAQR